jgi:hypothetical protein
MGMEGLGHLKKSSNLIGNRTRDQQSCSIVLQPTKLPRTCPMISFVRVSYDNALPTD